MIAYVLDPGRGATDLVILAAQDFTGEPVARVHLPVRVPSGLYGNGVPGGEPGQRQGADVVPRQGGGPGWRESRSCRATQAGVPGAPNRIPLPRQCRAGRCGGRG
ncbi:carotenoid oxygenase family protein [Kitasatospora sp. NPDC093102]|uniref:carotenoid oxygenase family protein n=1 Tax=Kitasatospora sp. NPDC093102 TaxID=3155069 RepID=UPI003446155A